MIFLLSYPFFSHTKQEKETFTPFFLSFLPHIQTHKMEKYFLSFPLLSLPFLFPIPFPSPQCSQTQCKCFAFLISLFGFPNKGKNTFFHAKANQLISSLPSSTLPPIPPKLDLQTLSRFQEFLEVQPWALVASFWVVNRLVRIGHIYSFPPHTRVYIYVFVCVYNNSDALKISVKSLSLWTLSILYLS